MITVVSDKFETALKVFAEERKNANAHAYGVNPSIQSELLDFIDPVNYVTR